MFGGVGKDDGAKTQSEVQNLRKRRTCAASVLSDDDEVVGCWASSWPVDKAPLVPHGHPAKTNG